MTEIEKKPSRLREITDYVGLPTIIIGGFFVLVLIGGGTLGISVTALLSDTVKRFGMNGILVLAMVPAIQSGTGPNFALPLGIVCGLLAVVCSISLNFEGWAWLISSAALAVVFASVVGYIYGRLMNAVKGSEMTIATYTGFSFVELFCIIWLVVPFGSSKMQWFIGDGLRETIQLDAVGGAQLLNNILAFKIGPVNIPTGMLLVLFGFCLFVFLFFRSKTGIAISAGGINPQFAAATGLNINRNRIIANIVSTVLAALGIIVYSQSYGYAQLYLGPLKMAFAAVAAVLIGGATAQRARVSHVLIGTFLYQGLLTTALPMMNEIFRGTDLSEVLRMIIQNGVILYALTKVKRGDGK